MKLHKLIKSKGKGNKRVGRGIGSGLGKTAGRGTKGQKSRGKLTVAFSGNNLYKKLPLRRGLGNPQVSDKFSVVNLADLGKLKAKTIVDIEQLLKLGLIKEKDAKKGVKILGNGEINVSLTVRLPVSQRAKKKIEEKGGKVEYV
ncbi:50S ribosomal protein L15 [Candidatus Daviesbacteria bacterium]|nr:50S ribosomal protein L15 [Candidatus Daviesbacteria bacterium]